MTGKFVAHPASVFMLEAARVNVLNRDGFRLIVVSRDVKLLSMFVLVVWISSTIGKDPLSEEDFKVAQT